MKILQVINSLDTGGAEKLLLDTIPRYNSLGIETDVLLLNGTEYPFLKALKEQSNCKIHSLGRGSVYNLFLVFKIIKYIKQYDIIHVHLFPAQYFVVLAKILSRAKTPLILTEHNTANRRLDNRFFRLIDKRIYLFYQKIICISEEIYGIIKNHVGFNDNRLQVIENGIDLSKINNASPLKLKDIHYSIRSNDHLIVQVAGFREQKDQQTLIMAMKLLPTACKLILVGEGVLRNTCEKLVKKLKLEDRVFFIGVREDVPRILKTASIIVLSTKYEGLSLSSLEGMASGKPFIASNVLGLKDIVAGAGLLFSQGDEKELAAIILELLNDKVLYNEVAKKCQERAALYDICTMVDKHVSLYQSLIR